MSTNCEISIKPLIESEYPFSLVLFHYLHWFSDDTVRKYLSPTSPEPRKPGGVADSIRFTNTFFSNQENQERFGIFLHEEHLEFIGHISLRYSGTDTAEIAYVIGDTTDWGKGYAKKASLLALKHLEEKNIKKVIASTNKDNIGSIKILLSLGFVEVSVIDSDNQLWFELDLETNKKIEAKAA